MFSEALRAMMDNIDAGISKPFGAVNLWTRHCRWPLPTSSDGFVLKNGPGRDSAPSQFW
jgi:hypothetical protein